MEEEDDPEDKEGMAEIKSGVESEGRRNTILIVPSVDFTPWNWRFAKDLKDFISADGTILSDSEGDLLEGPVNKKTEESK